jgi:undecaprenyl diphosphate synthase
MAEPAVADLPESIPQHIAIIMDGNGRWARSRGLPRLAGHRAGTENLRNIIKACVEFGVGYLTIYAFSTENWRRPDEEVSGLMSIFEEVFERELAELNRQKKVISGVEKTKNNDKLVLNIAFNYGGRDEIVYAVQQIVAKGVTPDKVTEDLISEHLYTRDIPEPDLVIRTSGEQRISNFLIWQAAYAEWVFPDTFWPDFGRDQLLAAIQEYGNRERRYGSVVQS